MKDTALPLENVSISQIYIEGQGLITYQVPIYQRNYAWEDTEINALVKDVLDSYEKDKDSVYYIGTLVTYKRGDNLFEVIDGQQRLTTIYLLLKALETFNIKGVTPKNKLTYSARQISKDTIEKLPNIPEVYDEGIKNGFNYAQSAIENIVGPKKEEFKNYFLKNVKIIHYRVPKDVDLNHYFEVMNSRGEQLEKHEIVKARLGEHLNGEELTTFSMIWEACSDMNRYIQQKYHHSELFGANYSSFNDIDVFKVKLENKSNNYCSVNDLLKEKSPKQPGNDDKEKQDSFQSIIDFPNFLLIVLKLTRILTEDDFKPETFSLDDKELIEEFNKFKTSKENAKLFIHNLIKAKYFLDNYIVHHVKTEKEHSGDNPWELEYYHEEGTNRHPKNLIDIKETQDELVHLLSMFEVTFTAKQRKNYLLYCLLYLFKNNYNDKTAYCDFIRKLSYKLFYDIYLNKKNLNDANNLPKPNAFDSEILNGKNLVLDIKNKTPSFESIYLPGSMNIPLFVFNFTDYKLWMKYANELRGNKTKKEDLKRKSFFNDLGCSDFDLDPFTDFYFSRTRKSLEHYYPQAKAGEDKKLSDTDINRFGNFAMISADANSSGSNWDPKQKLGHYTDKKADPVGVASLKFKIMMQICSDNDLKMRNGELSREEGFEWTLEDMKIHQEKILNIIFAEN